MELNTRFNTLPVYPKKPQSRLANTPFARLNAPAGDVAVFGASKNTPEEKIQKELDSLFKLKDKNPEDLKEWYVDANLFDLIHLHQPMGSRHSKEHLQNWVENKLVLLDDPNKKVVLGKTTIQDLGSGSIANNTTLKLHPLLALAAHMTGNTTEAFDLSSLDRRYANIRDAILAEDVKTIRELAQNIDLEGLGLTIANTVLCAIEPEEGYEVVTDPNAKTVALKTVEEAALPAAVDMDEKAVDAEIAELAKNEDQHTINMNDMDLIKALKKEVAGNQSLLPIYIYLFAKSREQDNADEILQGMFEKKYPAITIILRTTDSNKPARMLLDKLDKQFGELHCLKQVALPYLMTLGLSSLAKKVIQADQIALKAEVEALMAGGDRAQYFVKLTRPTAEGLQEVIGDEGSKTLLSRLVAERNIDLDVTDEVARTASRFNKLSELQGAVPDEFKINPLIVNLADLLYAKSKDEFNTVFMLNGGNKDSQQLREILKNPTVENLTDLKAQCAKGSSLELVLDKVINHAKALEVNAPVDNPQPAKKKGNWFKRAWNEIKTGVKQIGNAIRRKPVAWALFLGAVALSFASVVGAPIGIGLILANGFGWLDKPLGLGNYYQE